VPAASGARSGRCSHHPLRHHPGVDTDRFGQCALHQQLADADPEASADQLDQQESLGGIEFVPVAGDPGGLRLGWLPAQGQQSLLDPDGQPEIAVPRRWRKHMRDGLGQISYRLVALVEQPSSMPARAQASDRSTAVGTTRRGLPPDRK
jgi:hypothetical protein